MKSQWVRLALLVIGALGFLHVTRAQSSAHYTMKRVTTVAGAQRSNSSHFTNSVVAAQMPPSGAQSFCNTGYVNSLGFWSVKGALPVPIQLNATRSTVEPAGSVDLTWSGAEALYDVYRAFTPQDLVDPSNLDRETAECDGTDALAYQSDVIFYTVMPKP